MIVPSRTKRRLASRAVVAVAAASALLSPILPLEHSAALTRRPEFGTAVSGNLDLLGRPVALPDYEGPAARRSPTSDQLRMVRALGAHVQWTKYGTPASLIRYGAPLSAAMPGSAQQVARAWVRGHRVLFRLSGSDVRRLTVVNDSTLRWSPSHVVLFRQAFGGLPAGQDGMITVGVRNGRVYYVSSSAAGSESLTNRVALSPMQAWLHAAANVGLRVEATAVRAAGRADSWTLLAAPEFAQVQRARLRAFPTVDQGARAAYETVVENVHGGRAIGYTLYVDAATGTILFRHNDVDQLADLPSAMVRSTIAMPKAGAFSGSFSATACSKTSPLTTSSSNKTIVVVANADQPANDILLNLLDPSGHVVAGSDEATTPEAIEYMFPSPPPDRPPFYSAQVCPSPNPLGPFMAPFSYHGVYTTSDQSTPSVPTIEPEWSYFLNSPSLNYSSKDTRVIGCWSIPPANGGLAPQHPCAVRLNNPSARGPWDYDFATDTPTFTTVGNAAQTRQAWLDPEAPGPFVAAPIQPFDPDRTYGLNDQTFTPPGESWTNSWYTSKCNPSTLFNPAANDADILASTTNLFAGHNRMHDWSYQLGFTEQNYNLQQDNFGNTTTGPYPVGRDTDPEVGDVQAGALDGGAPEYLGRDNANQLTLNDGVPGITNQYLFQPLAGAFYAPCADGSFDFEVFGHEYTHAISNRMVGGPDDGLTGQQAGSMGESWSDQDALEYLHEYNDFLPGENPWALGPYATGNNTTGIRNYALDHDPLNFGDIGYDIPGPEVHADGEIWSAVAYVMRQALVQKWNAPYPAGDQALQARCANGLLRPDRCPGNRRWIQDVYDGFLLMQPSVSMLDARDAYLAADLMRYGLSPAKNNQAELWNAFATHGFGIDATTADTNDTDPVPGFVSPLEGHGTVEFRVQSGKAPVKDAVLYVGDYQAGVTPVADTNPKTKLPETVKMAPGTYSFVLQADGYGLHRLTVKAAGGKTTRVLVHLHQNWVSLSQGARVAGSDANACAKSKAAPCGLVDDTESTNWTASTSTNVNTARPSVAIHMAQPHWIRGITVSAMLHAGQSRFTALRQFRIEACDAGHRTDCTKTANFRTVYTSPPDAFPAVIPRPLAPNLIFRGFRVQPFHATDVRLVVLNNECTGAPAYQDPNNKMDADPTNPTDCPSGSSEGMTVNTAELELFDVSAADAATVTTSVTRTH